MGLIFTKLFDVFGKLERRIVIVGFDAAGKATVLYKLKLGGVQATIPIIGFTDVEYNRLLIFVYTNVKFIVCCMGGPDRIRKSGPGFAICVM